MIKAICMGEKTLIIEDDISILRVLKDNLIFEGYIVDAVSDGTKGFEMAMEGTYDLLLLDLMLPGINGYEICRRIKKEKPHLPVIMITARGTEMDKIAGLDIGADDYLTKPFSMPELLARIRAVLRRAGQLHSDFEICIFGTIKLDFKRFQAFKGDHEIKLSSKEFAIMKHLTIHEGEVIPRQELLDVVWGHEVIPDTRTVDNFILDLRKKIELNPSDPKHILTVRGAGYKFVR
jgi:DNA-binding response OmpR family regulator